MRRHLDMLRSPNLRVRRSRILGNIQPIDLEQFLTSLDSSDEFAYQRSWTTFVLKSYIPEITPEFLEAAFVAWDHWSQKSSVEVNHHLNIAGLGVRNVIQKHVEESPEVAEIISRRVVKYFSSPNIDIASASITFFQEHSEQFALAEETLAKVASSDSPQPVPEPSSGSKSLRAVAYQVLFYNDSHYLSHPDTRTAGLEFLQSSIEWNNQSPSDEKMKLIAKLETILRN
jgi:hypothetical protein